MGGASAAALRSRPLACPTCRGTMRVVAFITQRSVIDQILTHLRTRAMTAAHDCGPCRRAEPPIALGAREPGRGTRAAVTRRRRPARLLTALRSPRPTRRGHAACAVFRLQPRVARRRCRENGRRADADRPLTPRGADRPPRPAPGRPRRAREHTTYSGDIDNSYPVYVAEARQRPSVGKLGSGDID